MSLKIKKQVYDNVHGYIGLTEMELKIIDTPIFQRLRYIKQLGPTYLVYPGATHTRFAHSLGTMFMIDLFLRNAVKMDVSDDDAQKLRLAGLLHDIGHYPFSHTLEHTVMHKFGGMSHEEQGSQLIKRFLEKELENYHIDEIVRMISGKTKPEFGMLLSSTLDADRSDYMLRDSYNTGVLYGKINVMSMLRIATFEKDKIVFEKDESPIENFLIGRYHLYKTVIHHKTAAGFNVLLERIFEFLVKDGFIANPTRLIENEDILYYTDDTVISAMYSYLKKGKSKSKKEMIFMFLNRAPLELAHISAKLLEGNEAQPHDRTIIKKLEEDPTYLEKFASDAGIDPEWIFPMAMKNLSFIEEESEIYIRRKDGLEPIGKGNTVVLNMLLGKVLYDSRIYTRKGMGKKIAKALSEAR